MDIDDLARHDLAQLRRQDLHVPRQHDELNVMLLDEIQDLSLLLLLGVLVHGQMVKFDSIAFSQRPVVRVVADNDWNLNTQLLILRAEQEVVQAMADLRHHDQHLGLLGLGSDGVIHLQVTRQLSKRLLERVRRLAMPEMYSHKEPLASRV